MWRKRCINFFSAPKQSGCRASLPSPNTFLDRKFSTCNFIWSAPTFLHFPPYLCTRGAYTYFFNSEAQVPPFFLHDIAFGKERSVWGPYATLLTECAPPFHGPQYILCTLGAKPKVHFKVWAQYLPGISFSALPLFLSPCPLRLAYSSERVDSLQSYASAQSS